MRHIPIYLICIIIGVFLWQSLDIATYELYHAKKSTTQHLVTEEQTFLEDARVIASPQKEKWLLDSINWAKKEIKLAVYMFTVPSLMEALLQAKKRGVDIKIILEKNPYNATSINKEAVQFFRKNSLDFHETDDQFFSFMHAKYMIIDDEWIISTANWTRSSFSSNREFFILGKDIEILNDLRSLFKSDFWGDLWFSDHNKILAWPTNARERLLHFISSSRDTIKIYMPDISDEESILEIQKACKNGKNISILLNESKENTINGNKISQNWCPKIRIMKNPSLHAKVIIIDDISGFVGSFNFTKNSLENNRELWVFIDGKSIWEIVNIFWQDWQKSIAF